ncbi:LysR family transcriptional regulator [Pseudoalteromonas denitrificans]|uniref:DNA-binding transcriptional regulator, LysR family n=1 Tax=Pseudoalteromonas denitrificans DSM 6059 TaxID=1123010 RepID=A0A1I1NB82_9GAMM|nr:LysR family transcriptional regulator [Pseudoalteromonas denitrificans]SFC94725.1 DNA-binding transcriptional regulator, LysR family [Pseudoalteromonas denitrificans DSM 6059]
MDKFEAIRSFIEVANTGSFTEAADKLELSRVKVTRHIKELEDWLNVRLLHRTTRSVSLTSPGHDLMQHCEQIINEVSGLESLARSHNEELTGEIRIATPIGLGQNLLYEVVEAFSVLHPKVVFQLILSDRNAQLVDERIDVALRYTKQPDDSFIARRLMQIESVLCCSEHYLKKHGDITSPQQLVAHNCLIHISQNIWSFIDKQEYITVPVTGCIKANDLGVLVRAALNGIGVAYLPCDLANTYLATGELKQMLPKITLPSASLWAVYLSRSYQRPVVRAFIDFLAQQWQDDIKVFQ